MIFFWRASSQVIPIDTSKPVGLVKADSTTLQDILCEDSALFDGFQPAALASIFVPMCGLNGWRKYP
jgi:hypothetical protein